MDMLTTLIYNCFHKIRYIGNHGITSATVNTQQTKYIDFLIPGLIGFSILTSPMFSLVNISSEYKKTKLFKQLSLTPLTKMEWLISKMIWYIVLTIAGFLLMVGVGIFAFGAHVAITPWLIPFLSLGSNALCSARYAGWHSNKEP